MSHLQEIGKYLLILFFNRIFQLNTNSVNILLRTTRALGIFKQRIDENYTLTML